MHIWRAVQGEGSELGKTPEPGALPLSGERAPSSERLPSPGLSPCLGRGVRAQCLARPQSAPPSASPRTGVERAKGVESGWWRDAESRDNQIIMVIYRRFLMR